MTLFGSTQPKRRLFAPLLAILATLALACAGLFVIAPAASAATAKNCTTSTPLSQRPTLQYGSVGTCVTVLQQNLMNRGYNLGVTTPTKNFLTNTRAAVLSFQRSHGLWPDAIVGPKTWAKLGMSYTAPKTSTPPTAPTTKYNIYRGPNTTSAVVLSFDDCPRSLSSFKSAVLAAERLNIGLWLFPTGDCLRSGKFDANYARSHGHYVMNHSVSHPDLRTLSYTSVKRQLGSPGVVTNYGRPPYGALNTNVRNAYKAVGMQPVLWTVDTRDWEGRSRAAVVNHTIAYSTKGGNVLMHMQWNGFGSTAIKQMKTGLNKKGLAVCKNYVGKTPVKPTKFCR